MALALHRTDTLVVVVAVAPISAEAALWPADWLSPVVAEEAPAGAPMVRVSAVLAEVSMVKMDKNAADIRQVVPERPSRVEASVACSAWAARPLNTPVPEAGVATTVAEPPMVPAAVVAQATPQPQEPQAPS